MPRNLFIVTFAFLFFHNSNGQSATGNINDSSVVYTKFKHNLFYIKERLVVDSVFALYADDDEAAAIAHNLAQDTAFLYSLLDPASSSHDALILSVYKIPSVIQPIDWVSDYGQLFTGEELIKLNLTLSKYERETGNEIAVVTFDSSFVENQDFDSLVLYIHKLWAIGKAEHSGILIGVSPGAEKTRVINGLSAKNRLSNEEIEKVVDNTIIPEFQKRNYFIGLNNAIQKLVKN